MTRLYPLIAIAWFFASSILPSAIEAKEQHGMTMLIEGIPPAYMNCALRSSKESAREYTLANLDEAEILTSYLSFIDERCFGYVVEGPAVDCQKCVAPALNARLALRAGLQRKYIPKVEVDNKRNKLDDFDKLSSFLIGRVGYSYIAFGSFRGAVAEYLVRSDYPEARDFDFARISALRPMIRANGELMTVDYVASNGDSAGWERDSFRGMLLNDRIAECAARRDPESAHRLILADFGSEAEQSAFQSVLNAVGECLPDDVSISIDRLAFRYSMASVFYRLAHAADSESDT